MKKTLLTLVLAAAALLPAGTVSAQYPIQMMMRAIQNRTSFDMNKEYWNATWIAVPGSSQHDYGVYYFRKDINLGSKPAEFTVYVTGDTRYKLYVNGTLVSVGPGRSDSKHWKYETVDLAQYLKAGKNVVAAQVWNEGQFNPVPNATIRTGFLMMGEGDAKVLNTDNTWKCIQDPSYQPLRQRVPGYYALGSGEGIDMSKHISDWDDPNADLSAWKDAEPYDLGTPHDVSAGTGVYSSHMLVANQLPQVERFEKRLATVRKNDGVSIPAGWPAKNATVTIPAGKSVDILLDQTELTNGYFNLNFSKGSGAKVKVQYAEALYTDKSGAHKGNRNEVEGKYFIGRFDSIASNGRDNQQFTTLDWRTFRYVNLHVETAGEPLQINDISSTFVGYPFRMNARLDTDREELVKMLEIGWRTARLCAIETYMDCPYYEQLQYLGDTRIQALVSLYNSGDDRLVKNYMHQADLSRNAEGITMGRAPSELAQYITPYALSYIYTIHDYMLYGADTDFVKDLIPGMEQILWYFGRYQDEDGLIQGLPGWNFSDWVDAPGWQLGVAQVGPDGHGILMDLQLLLGYQRAADVENFQGNTYMADQYTEKATRLKEAIQSTYWDASKGLYAQTSEKKLFSQHAGALAILAGMVGGDDAKQMARKLLTDTTLAPCSIYYKFYLHEALIKAGLGDEYLTWLDKWRENIANGLTTWGETSDVDGTRSDCHAWGSSLNIEFFRTLLGIDSAAPGFADVKIEPHLGDINQIGGAMPHPKGEIKVSYQRKGTALKAEIDLPDGVDGSFVWNGTTRMLQGGHNSIEIK